MSILKELVKATGEKQKSGEKDQPFYGRLVRSIAEFNDSIWEKLSEQSQEWYNDAAKALNDGKNIPELDGAGAKNSREKIEPRGKKGNTNKDDNNGDKVMKIEDLEEGVEVVIKGKKYKVLAEGEVSAVKKKNIIILNDDGEKIKVPKDKVVSIEVLGENESDVDGEEVEFSDVEKGDNIKIVTEDEDEVEGIVEKKTKKAITIDGEKYPADEIETIHKVSGEEAEEEEEAGDGEEVEFSDVEKGDNIKIVTEDEDEVEGIVEKKTKKAITIDGEKYPADEIETIHKVSGEEAEEEEEIEEGESALNEKQLEALDTICKFPKMKIDKMKDKIKKKGPKIKASELDEVYDYAHLVIDKLVENGKL